MNQARRTLHVAGLLIPIAAVFGWDLLAMDGALLWREALLFAISGTLAAQAAALLCWPMLDRTARTVGHGWLAGMGMALTTHVLFGVVTVLYVCASSDLGNMVVVHPTYFLRSVLLYVAMTVLAVGIVTFPLAMGAAKVVVIFRRRELKRLDN